MNQKLPRICYFGIYDPEFSRNKIYRRGLKELGVEIIECRSQRPGWRKYVDLWKQYRRIRHSYDFMIVGYPGYIIVPFAKLISFGSSKPVVFDALCTFHEAQIVSRDAYAGIPFRSLYTKTIDWLANTFADLVLVETKSQKEHYVRELNVSEKKVAVIYTGVDDLAFAYDPSIPKANIFTVLFRGRLMNEAGVKYIFDAAKILEKENIRFVVIGFGFGEVVKQLEKQFRELKLTNTEFIPRQLPFEVLKKRMQEAHVSLGQFEQNSRVAHTIPHKAFESMAMKLPYITGQSPAVAEIIGEGKEGVFVPLANAQALAEAILFLKNNPETAHTLAENAFFFYRVKLTSRQLAQNILDAVQMNQSR